MTTAALPALPSRASSWFDAFTGKVTMYRVVLVSLVALVIVAVVAAGLGAIAYDPLAIVVDGAAVVVATVVGNRLIALAFRVTPHSESAVVTALILLFLFQPSLTASGVGAVALAGVIASASKYLLAIRGRHVANPAAIAVVVMSIAVPSAFPGWWIGAPVLLPFVLVASFVILRRTRKLLMGTLFAVVATVGVTLAGLSFGSTLPVALSAAVLSSPVVFFAGFMLSEPLTLPPRRWQQLVLAVVVGVLFAVPFHVGPVFGTYELALVIGNVLAFAVGQRRGVRLDFVGRRQLDRTSWELLFRPRRRVRFRAGQYLELGLPHAHADLRGQRRVFSIVSAPSDETLRIGVKVAEPSSSFKTRLLELTPGEVVTGTAIGGDFVLPRDAGQPLLLVAGGIGITPFVSQVRALAGAGASPDFVLVHAVSSLDELSYLPELALGAAGADSARGSRRGLLVAPSRPDLLPLGWEYLGSGPLTAAMLGEAVPDAARRRGFVAGSPGFVAGVRRAMRSAGLRRVTTDAFNGY
ncbi:ferredoxin--NADP reductase [Frondihabitans cladoniiphilus]|uniref:FAD-binding FR-type domain-containing protein n=1 Tax=Frondihabitans cladoniiphilus TaxID=715785 RepID=A0ABP8W1E7_9MICO